MPDIVITEFMDEEAVREGLKGYDILYDPALVDRPTELLRIVGDARALIVRNRTQVRGDLLAAAKKLTVIGRLGVGLDNIDVAACRARDIAVFPATGANDVAVAEYVVCTAMMLLRGAYRATGEVVAGAWPRNRLMGRETMGKRLGLIGFGRIAKETARRAAALGMSVSAYDPRLDRDSPEWRQPWGPVEPFTLEALLAVSDVVSLHVPLTQETANLIDAAAIRRMKPGAVFINTARGGIVDEEALAHALEEGRLAGAAVDVFEEEPLTATRAAIFKNCPTLVATPHIAGVTAESNVRVSWATVENVRRHLGDPAATPEAS